MSISVADNFSYLGTKPLDARVKYSSVADMVAVSASNLYDGCLAYVTATKKNYQYDSTNTSDPTLGKWRELEAGGGGSTYTAGDGIDITSDVISTKQSASGDIDEIIDVYPQAGNLVSIVNAFNKGDIYSTTERMIGQWQDSKPLYQKTISCGALPNNDVKNVNVGTTGITVVKMFGIAIRAGQYDLPLPYTGVDASSNPTDTSVREREIALHYAESLNQIVIRTYTDRSAWTNTYVTIQYTKSTDTAISIGETTEYSTTEKVVGTWVSGEPIYQKTVQVTLPTTSSQGTIAESYVSLNESIDKFISVDGFFIVTGNGVNMPINASWHSNVFTLVRGINNSASSNKNSLHIENTNNTWNGLTAYVTIQYTKTT